MHFISKRAVILGVVASLGFAGVAQAAVDDTSVTLTGGGIDFTTAPLFSGFGSSALTGAARDATTEIADWGVNDARGTGLGYTVSMAASALVSADTVPITMTGAVLSVTAPTPSKALDNDSAAPAASDGDISGSGAQIVAADANEGLGDWTYAQAADDLTLAVPASARIGAYTSTITTTITAGV